MLRAATIYGKRQLARGIEIAVGSLVLDGLAHSVPGESVQVREMQGSLFKMPLGRPHAIFEHYAFRNFMIWKCVKFCFVVVGMSIGVSPMESPPIPS